MNLTALSKILLSVLWLATMLLALAWYFIPDELPFEAEPITIILGLVSTAVTAMVREFGDLLEKERYSTSYALAYGYVNNFLEPALDKIAENQSLKEEEPTMFIYIPEKLSELDPDQVKRTMRQVRKLGFSDEIINLDLKKGRVRDLIVISQNAHQKAYFDFPNTLLTLNSYIDYKSSSAKNSFDMEEKIKLGKKYINQFESHLITMLREKGLEHSIKFINKDLDFKGLVGP